MPDGVVLLGDHYRAAEDDRPLPAVLIRSPQAGGSLTKLPPTSMVTG
jgi:predicted acyl esterase